MSETARMLTDWQRRKRRIGQCVTCRAPVDAASIYYCAKHRRDASDRKREAYRRRHPDFVPMQCGFCSEPGHNTRTCEKWARKVNER